MSAANDSDASPGLVCPGCGKPIDALRAGHVAIMDGSFRYFCDRSCKLDYLEKNSRLPAEAVTVPPPRVATIGPAVDVVNVPVTPVPDLVSDQRLGEREAKPEPPPPESQLPPSSKNATKPAAREWLDTAPFVGLVAGFLAFSVGLAGERVARFRLAFSLIAGLILVTVLWKKRSASHSLSGVVRGFPTVVACLLATAAMFLRLPSASDLASFCGLAAFVTLLVHVVGERAERDMEEQARFVTELRRSAERAESSVDGSETFPWLEHGTTRGALLEQAARLFSDADTRADVHAPVVRALRVNLERASMGAFAVVLVAALFIHISPVEALASACAGALSVSLSGTLIAVRIGVHASIFRALRRGVFYRDAHAFELAGKTDVAVICARGTVLLGEPEIISVETLAAVDAERILALASGAVQTLPDPSAQAVIKEVRQRRVTPEVLRSPLVHAGLGVTALTASGETVVVGSRSFLLQEKVSVAVADARVNALEGGGRSVLLVALATKLIGIIALQDGLRPGARAAVQKLLEARVEPVLLSGEARDTCETIARALDVDHIRPEVLPQDRANEVKALGEAEHSVAVIGHLDADGEALSAAGFSVAMQGGGHLGEAGAVVASDDVRDAIFAITNAKRARRFTQTVLAIGLAPGVAAVIALAFGAPRGFAPVAAVLASVFVLLMAGESASKSAR